MSFYTKNELKTKMISKLNFLQSHPDYDNTYNEPQVESENDFMADYLNYKKYIYIFTT